MIRMVHPQLGKPSRCAHDFFLSSVREPSAARSSITEVSLGQLLAEIGWILENLIGTRRANPTETLGSNQSERQRVT